MDLITINDMLQWAVEDVITQHPELSLDEDRYSELQEICEKIQGFKDDFAAESASVYISEEGEVCITLNCIDFLVENGRSHPIFDVLRTSCGIGFKNCDDYLEVLIIFDGLLVN